MGKCPTIARGGWALLELTDALRLAILVKNILDKNREALQSLSEKIRPKISHKMKWISKSDSGIYPRDRSSLVLNSMFQLAPETSINSIKMKNIKTTIASS